MSKVKEAVLGNLEQRNKGAAKLKSSALLFSFSILVFQSWVIKQMTKATYSQFDIFRTIFEFLK